MWFWWFMLACNIIVPITMIIAGFVMANHPSKEINFLFGYRTTRSMKNMDTWVFAHKHCGRLWQKIGWITLPLTIIVHSLFYGTDDSVISIAQIAILSVQVAILILSIIPTESALRKTFDENGVRK